MPHHWEGGVYILRIKKHGPEHLNLNAQARANHFKCLSVLRNSSVKSHHIDGVIQ